MLVATLNDPRGEVVCEVIDDGSPLDERSRVTASLSSLGVPLPPGAEIVAVDLGLARAVIANMFQGWLSARMSWREALSCAGEVVGWFADDVRCYSTYAFTWRDPPHGNLTYSGRSLLGDTYDIGVVLIDDDAVGVLWLADED